MKVLLFDIDGTLVNTARVGTRALDRTFNSLFGWQDAGQQVEMAGRTDLAICRDILKKNGIVNSSEQTSLLSKIKATYLQCLDQEISKSTTHCLMPGILELLKILHKQEHLLVGLLTGNIEEGAQRKLSMFGIENYFSFGAFGSDSEFRQDLVPLAKARAEKICGHALGMDSNIWVIGDTPRDIQCARANGVFAVAVATGFVHAYHDLEQEKPDLLIKDFSAPQTFLQRLVE